MQKQLREKLERLHELAGIVWEGDGGEEVSAELAEMWDLTALMLAEPDRNCDNYDDIENAWHDYKLSHPSSYFDAMHLWRFAKWLFASATEQKGGNGAELA